MSKQKGFYGMRPPEAVNFVFQIFDELISTGQFDKANTVLQSVKPEKLHPSVLRALLVVTQNADLPCRPALYQRIIELSTFDRGPSVTENLFGSLQKSYPMKGV